MKKLLRREGKNREVLECMPSSFHQLIYRKNSHVLRALTAASKGLTHDVSTYILFHTADGSWLAYRLAELITSEDFNEDFD